MGQINSQIMTNVKIVEKNILFYSGWILDIQLSKGMFSNDDDDDDIWRNLA